MFSKLTRIFVGTLVISTTFALFEQESYAAASNPIAMRVKPFPVLSCEFLSDDSGNSAMGTSKPKIASDMSDDKNPVYYVLVRAVTPGAPLQYIPLAPTSGDRTSSNRVETHSGGGFDVAIRFEGYGIAEGQIKSGNLSAVCNVE